MEGFKNDPQGYILLVVTKNPNEPILLKEIENFETYIKPYLKNIDGTPIEDPATFHLVKISPTKYQYREFGNQVVFSYSVRAQGD